MSITGTLSTVTNYSVGSVAFVSNAVLNNPKVTALALAVLSTYSLPTVSAGPAAEIGCMVTCSAAALVHPVAAAWWAQCMQFCVLLGFAPTP